MYRWNRKSQSVGKRVSGKELPRNRSLDRVFEEGLNTYGEAVGGSDRIEHG